MKELLASLKEIVCNDESLRYYQFDNKLKVYSEWSTCDSVMLQMPTGTGKTRLFVSIVNDILSCRMHNGVIPSVLLLVHRKELVSQIAETLASYGLEYGIIQAGVAEKKTCHIQVASVQSLVRRLDRWEKVRFEFIIIDEAHHTPANTYLWILDAFPGTKLLGVTATPYRKDGWGFAHIFDKLVVSPEPIEFIRSGFLSNYDYYSVPSKSPIIQGINSVPIEKGDFAEDSLIHLLDRSSIRTQIVDSYMKYGYGKKAIVFTINKEHNKHLCEEYRKRGINAATIDCDTSSCERKRIIDAFRIGNIQVLLNVNLFTEGFDCPDVEVIQLARPTLSLAMYLQQVGRGLRTSPNKSKSLFIDNVGLYLFFGLPSDHRSWDKYWDSTPMLLFQKLASPDSRSPKDTCKIKEGNEEVRLIYSTAPEKAIEKPIATSTPTQKDNEKLAPILLLDTYLQHWN